MTEAALLTSARAGDEVAFGSLVASHRAGLQAHCYRMLGSVQDAEDAVQETLVRAWSGIGRFEGRSSLRTWLYSIATNASLRMIERRPPRIQPEDFEPSSRTSADLSAQLGESIWVEPFPDSALRDAADDSSPDARFDQLESVELAFVAALQHLPATQRAALILRDVLGFSAAETADSLATSAASVNSALQRAHANVDQRLPAQSQQQTLRDLADDDLKELVKRYVDAWERSDVEAVSALLTEDVKLTMPPFPTWYEGRGRVLDFLSWSPITRDWQTRLTTANGQPAIGFYERLEGASEFTPHAMNILTLRGGRIAEMRFFLEPKSLGWFGLPDVLATPST
jgi:RNA polymerase sigma-70 factor (ECF subfamily)